MKKLRTNPKSAAIGRAVGTISAAALMLGVSHAATVGFNFQCNYCNAASYAGAIVSAPAFGIGTNGWESLSQMDTGYGCPPGYYTLTNEINSATATGTGLNPLPNGSVTVVWSGYTANVSGFGGYTRSAPHYTFGGNGHKPGNEEVYWGFIRDGVNFGPGSVGGDNNQPGYVIDIVGLKSLFTNSPFAVELIASADSMRYITNAFIIDATVGTTQSVVYPSTPPVNDSGDTAWIRGIGGGLSTASDVVDTDHLQIIGNRAQHSAGATKDESINNGSTISGFIITDKPVITMPPNAVPVGPGDTITWSGYAVGVPPLSYQWRKDGVPIAGATLSTYTIASASASDVGIIDLMVTNLYGTAISAPVGVDHIVATEGLNFVVDSKPSGTLHDGLNNGATWADTNSDGTTTRTGVMQFTAANSNQVVVPASADFSGATDGTIMFWVRTPFGNSTGTGHTGSPGDGAMLFDNRTSSGLVIVAGENGQIFVQSSPSSAVEFSSASTLTSAGGVWHHVALVYSQANGSEQDLYIDGAFDAGWSAGADWSWPAGQEIELGSSHDSYWQKLGGAMDDFRFYSRRLTAAEVAQAMGGAVVDPTTLMVRYDFDAAPQSGITLKWGLSDVTLQSSDTASGTYTDVPGVFSPYSTAARNNQKFFRYKGHTPATVVSNPYLM